MTEASNTKRRTSKIEVHTHEAGGVVDSIVGRSMFDVRCWPQRRVRSSSLGVTRAGRMTIFSVAVVYDHRNYACAA